MRLIFAGDIEAIRELLQSLPDDMTLEEAESYLAEGEGLADTDTEEPLELSW